MLNGVEKDIPTEVSLTGLLEFFDLPKQRIAVELNLKVIRRDEWENVVVADNDQIEVIHFVGGG